jgi:hypothetical protein
MNNWKRKRKKQETRKIRTKRKRKIQGRID